MDVDEAAECAQTGFGRPDLARPERSTARPSRESTGPARGGQGFYKGALPWSSVVADVGLPPEWLATIVATSTVRTAVVSQKRESKRLKRKRRNVVSRIVSRHAAKFEPLSTAGASRAIWSYNQRCNNIKSSHEAQPLVVHRSHFQQRLPWPQFGGIVWRAVLLQPLLCQLLRLPHLYRTTWALKPHLSLVYRTMVVAMVEIGTLWCRRGTAVHQCAHLSEIHSHWPQNSSVREPDGPYE